ncbi:M1 family metallopeptidase [Microbulbifer agarilyticus]|uniref:M1 family metallopeptidase n=1 Tax=Microbulbifer agarilyticus TaxID=260552 RepID=UPI001CD6C2E8|nr:M1 family metallopeptidase [Microbulbifer agarilyticus]MCA0892831.1 M1 family metallopeptidase [Microbulbifer agarilyticus]
MRTRIALLLVLIFTFAGCSSDSDRDVYKEPMPLGSLGTNVRPHEYFLSLNIQPEQAEFSGTARISISIEKATTKIWLHGQDLQVNSVAFTQGEQTFIGSYEQANRLGVSSVSFSTPVSGSGDLQFSYTAPFSKSSSALHSIEENEEHYVFSQMQAIDARRVFPGFDDPQFKTAYSVEVTSADKNVVIFNTPVTKEVAGDEDNIRHIFATTKPLPTYLLAFAVGPFDIYEWDNLPKTELRDYEVPLRAIVTKGKRDKAEYALRNTQPLLEELENYFGTPYPYEKIDLIAHPQFGGAMENPGAIVYGEQGLLVDEDSTPATLQWYYGVHAHELAHMWFGNVVTPHWWEDIWLNESFASWLAAKAAHAVRPDLAIDTVQQKFSLGAINQDSTAASRQIQQPVRDNAEIGKTFDSVTYNKGAAVLAMVEAFVGEDRFRDGVRHHIQRFEHSVATSSQFFESMAAGSNEPRLQQVLQSFVEEVGAPTVDVEVSCSDDGAKLTATQSRYRPLGAEFPVDTIWQLPLCYKTGDSEACELISEEKTEIELASCPDYLMPNARSAGYYRWNLDADSWAKLLANRDALSVSELVNLSDSSTSAFKAGKLKSGAYVDILRALAKHENYEVASSVGDVLQKLRLSLLDGEATEDYRIFVEDMYAPRLTELRMEHSSDDSPMTRLDRRDTIDLMAMEAESERVIEILDKLGREHISAIEAGDEANSMPDDWINVALRGTAINADYDLLVRMEDMALSTSDQMLRDRMLYALSKSKDTKYIEHMFTELLFDERLSGHDRARMIVFMFPYNRDLQDRSFDFLVDNTDLVTEGIGGLFKHYTASAAKQFCNESQRQKAANFFAGAEEKIPGITRAANQSLEMIDQCIALRNANSEEFKRAISAERTDVADLD